MATPHRDGRALTVPQPSPRKQAEMEAGFVGASQQHRDAVEEEAVKIRDILRDQRESLPARTASAYALFVTLETMCQEQGIDFDLENLPQTINAAGLQTQKFHQELTQTRRQDDNVFGAQDPVNAPRPLDWDQTLAFYGCTQGDGLSEENPMYIGGTTYPSAPVIIATTMNLGYGLTMTVMSDAQQVIFAELRAVQWYGYKNHSYYHLKLSPFSCIAWCNFFTGHAFGPGLIPRLNAILKAADPSNKDAPRQQDVMRARALSQHGDLSPIERQFYGSLSAAMNYKSSKSNAYVKYLEIHEYATLGHLFQKMANEITDNPEGELGRSLERQGKPGCRDKSALFTAFSSAIGMRRDTFIDMVDKHNVLTQCAKAFGPGFLLLVTDQMITLYRNNARAAIDHIIPIVQRVIPSYRTLCDKLHEKIGADLLSMDPANNMKLSQKKIDTADSADDLVTRLTAMRQA